MSVREVHVKTQIVPVTRGGKTLNIIVNGLEGGVKESLTPLLKTDKAFYVYVGSGGLGQVAATNAALYYKKPIYLYLTKPDKYTKLAIKHGGKVVKSNQPLPFLVDKAALKASKGGMLLPLNLEFDDVVLKTDVPKESKVWMLDGSDMVKGGFPKDVLNLVRLKGSRYVNDPTLNTFWIDKSLGNLLEPDLKLFTNEDSLLELALEKGQSGDYVWTSGFGVK